MKAEHVIGAMLTLMVPIAAVEAFYEHPTYGRGMKALIAVANAAIAIGPSGV